RYRRAGRFLILDGVVNLNNHGGKLAGVALRTRLSPVQVTTFPSFRYGNLTTPGERPKLPNRKPWLGTAKRAGPSEHSVTVEPVRSGSVPPRRTLLRFQRTAPSEGQVGSALGPALCHAHRPGSL